MGRAGRLRAQQLFSLEPYIDAYDALYRRLVDGHETTNVTSIGTG